MNKTIKAMAATTVLASVLVGCDTGEVKKAAQLKAVEVVGNIAQRNMPDDVAGGFHNIPIEARELAPDVYQVTGIANTHMITTSEGNVLFDTGIVIQAADQIKAMQEVAPDAPKFIILSHSHADHMSSTPLWRDENSQIIAHREFVEENRYLSELEPYLWNRNRTVFPWLPERPPSDDLFGYPVIAPDILVTEEDYKFELGGVRFEVLSTPGAEGADNISLWLPDKKILFTGDFFGPLFPQFPNIFTMRGEKIRKPIEYIHSLNKLIALEPEMIVPSHHDPITGKENLKAALTKMRDAVQYVHDEVVAGMNAGKTVYELMEEIQLPPELELTQEHGMVSWGVRSIWEYYATWFHFDSTTELYPVPVRSVYAEVAELAGVDALIGRAEAHFAAGEPVKALHFLEMALAGSPGNTAALAVRHQVLNQMLEIAINGKGNNYEKDYLRARIAATEAEMETADQ